MQTEAHHAIQLSIRLDSKIYAAIRKEALAQGREVGEHIQSLLVSHAVEKLLDPAEGAKYALRESLIASAIETTLRLRHDSGMSCDISNQTFESCRADDRWLTDYAIYVEGDPYAPGNPRKNSLNKEIGFRIRKALDAEVDRDGNGKPITVEVAGSIIRRYTKFKVD